MHRPIICLISLTVFFFAALSVRAQSVDVVVLVADVPQFNTIPHEVTASSDSSPTNEQDTVTFSANAIDPESSSYYLIICRTNAVTENAGSAPTCPGGQWCVSGQTSNGNDAECSYTTSTNDVEANDWYAFACGSGLGFCSDASQGSGASGSPFYVNHAPIISSISNNGDQDPGDTIIWSVEADDSDTVGGNDSVKFFVCKSEDFQNNTCTYGHWCESTYGLTDPTCSYTIPDVYKDSLNGGYVYLIDNHGLVSSSPLQGTNSSFSVNNISPTSSNLTLNGGSDIVLNAGSSTNVRVTGIMSDSNSCMGDEIKQVEASLYRSGLGYGNCDQLSEADENNCYLNVSCQIKPGESCSGTTDTTLEYECNFSVQYHADPTDTGTIYADQNWMIALRVVDENGAFYVQEISQGVDINSLIAIQTDPIIGYGELNVGQTIDPLSISINVESFSNVGLDALVYGTGLTNSSNHEIPVENQRYAVEPIGFADAIALREVSSYFELNLNKPLTGSAERPIYWGITVPENLPAGDYSGANFLVAIKGDIAGW